MSHKNLVYRPEIDGLRAVAVMSVVIFHLNHQWLPGGFVGVDIFFVISGFLITSILLDDYEKGRFSFTRFYQRRIARIFPAFFTVALTTIIFTAFVYSSYDFAVSGVGLIAASLSIANMKYMFEGNYFVSSPDAKPFLHYWSLSVEEQFYAIFPLLLLILFIYARRYLSLVLLILFFGSLFLCIKLTQHYPILAFYLFPTRAWEILAGSLLALTSLEASNRYRRTFFNIAPSAGLILIGISLLTIHEGPDFPGWHAFVPVLGAFMVLISERGEVQSVGKIKKVLSCLPVVAVGKMSYSLYLWHWPIFSLVDYYFYFYSEEFRVLAKVGLSFLIAFISFRFIEAPARIFLNQAKNQRIAFVSFVIVLAFCVGLGFFIRKTKFIDNTLDDVSKGGHIFSVNDGPTTIVLMGDSNGSMYSVLIKEICKELGQNLTVISASGGDGLPNKHIAPESESLWLDSLSVIRKSKPKYLIVANHWTEKLDGNQERLERAIIELRPLAQHIILLNQPPILPKEVNRASIRNGLRPPFHESIDIQTKRRSANQYLLKLQSPSVSVVDVASQFETNDGNILVFDEQGHMLYQDSTHLSGYGVARVRNSLKKIVSLH